MDERNITVCVVGAGIAGITVASRLQRAGVLCALFEKSRGVGGRMATRRTPDGLHFDHGAQYFTAKSDQFRDALAKDSWRDHIAPWSPESTAKGWLVGTPMMNSPLKAHADSLDIQCNATVNKIQRHQQKWHVSFQEDRHSVLADYLIISAPAPQAMILTPFSTKLQRALSVITYAPCWTLMVALGASSGVDFCYRDKDDGVFSWMARDGSKPARDASIESWVVHATAAWSTQNLERSNADIVQALLPPFFEALRLPQQNPHYSVAHRWRYARVTHASGTPFIADETNSLFVVGDGCLGPRVECAFDSGNALAAHMIARL